MVECWARRLLAMLIALALVASVAVHLPTSAIASDGHAETAQNPGTAPAATPCHDEAEDSIPAAKLPACCLVYCTGCSSIPAAPSAPARTVVFIGQRFAADTPSQPNGHDIHPDPHPPRG